MNTAITYNDLPPVEREIADFYVGGLTMKEIAYKRDRSVNTVKNQIKKLFEKAGVRKDTEFAVWYFVTRFKITFELPQIKKVVATALFLGLFYHTLRRRTFLEAHVVG